MTDSALIRLFTLPILTDAIASGIVAGGVWWFYYKPPNILKSAYDNFVGGSLMPAADSLLRKPLENLQKKDPKTFNQIGNAAIPVYKFFDSVGLVPKKYGGLAK